MIEVRLKIPSASIFIKGDLAKEPMTKQMSELFLNPGINLLRANTEDDCTIFIPASNIAYVKNREED